MEASQNIRVRGRRSDLECHGSGPRLYGDFHVRHSVISSRGLVTSAHSPPLRGGEYFWSRRRFSLGIPSMSVEKWHSTPLFAGKQADIQRELGTLANTCLSGLEMPPMNSSRMNGKDNSEILFIKS